jgi:hypothetical protein
MKTKHNTCWIKPVIRNRCSAAHRCAVEAMWVCHAIFIAHYNYNRNAKNNCKNMNKYL